MLLLPVAELSKRPLATAPPAVGTHFMVAKPCCADTQPSSHWPERCVLKSGTGLLCLGSCDLMCPTMTFKFFLSKDRVLLLETPGLLQKRL